MPRATTAYSLMKSLPIYKRLHFTEVPRPSLEIDSTRRLL